MQRFASKKRYGANIIEHCVVWGIILILVGILFPVFGRARENAHRSSCQSNLKQIALGFKQYIQDYNKEYPPTNNMNTSTGTGGWVVLLKPYLKDAKCFQCPSDVTKLAPLPTSEGYTDYWMNGNVAGKHQTAFTYATGTFLLGETDTSAFGLGNHSATYDGFIDGNPKKTKIYGARVTNWYTELGSGATWAQQNASSAKHLDGSNYAFADGHVKWLNNSRPTNDTGSRFKSVYNPSFRVN